MHQTALTQADIIGVAEVSELTDLDVQRITRMLRAGDLPYATKLPGRTGAYLVKRTDAIALAERLLAEAEARASRIRAALAAEKAS